MKVTEENTKKN